MNTNPIIKSANQVIETEIQGLNALYDVLDDKFIVAVELIFSLKGRVIVSGMGKSGHIARKMAATFSSTGTSSFFVHPGEASHGDLGMITKDDAVILLSNSGETAELKDITYYCKRFAIPIIAIVRNKNSALTDAADIPIVLPAIQEVCNINAPTTSSTMMLALGDALAIALAHKRGFTKEDFHIFHPGGKLGAAFIKVKDLMRKDKDIPIATESELMSHALIEMSAKNLGCIGVIDKQNNLIGIITDGDLRRHMSKTLLDMCVKDVMTFSPITIRPETLVAEALNIMNDKSITSLFVTEDKKVLGILHLHDCLRTGVK
jgi:arabinose-5-phosphate isomerase